MTNFHDPMAERKVSVMLVLWILLAAHRLHRDACGGQDHGLDRHIQPVGGAPVRPVRPVPHNERAHKPELIPRMVRAAGQPAAEVVHDPFTPGARPAHGQHS